MTKKIAARHKGAVIHVAVPSPLRRTFDYLPPASGGVSALPASGMRVSVPFGRRKLVGIVTGSSAESVIETSRLKPVHGVLDDKPVFPPALLRMLTWAAAYYHHPIGEVFAAALPIRLRKPDSILSASSTSDSETDLSSAQSGNGAEANLSSTHLSAGPTLNAEQQDAVKHIIAGLSSFNTFLLDGVTGSGKTEVYMQVMAEQLRRGRQCLVLVPEIGLTPQTVERFSLRFAVPVVVLHSGLGEAERLAAWRDAAGGVAGIVIGTRSAIFTPLAKPGLIVVDEEHDASFKQQDGFRYSARDLAIVRGREEGQCVILGSATPSLESMHNAATGRFAHLRLTQPAGVAVNSRREIVDLSAAVQRGGLSEIVLHRIGRHLEQGNQVLVFINRRGFAPILSCTQCGWASKCERCVVHKTVHTTPRSLRCHHCGASERLPDICPACGQNALQTRGLGTQQLEHFLQTRFSTVPVLRIDRDSTRTKKRLNALLTEVQQGKPCILLGTQMLAKGHHFPQITLVAVVNADSGLFSADFRGQEQMCQTIIQVAGRAGRAERPGEVVIQSQYATHPSVQALAVDSYTDIAQRLLAERQQAGMPPFSHLCLIRADCKLMPPCFEFLERVAELARELNSGMGGSAGSGVGGTVGGGAGGSAGGSVEIIGPLPAPMEKRVGRWRAQLHFISGQRSVLQNMLEKLCIRIEELKQPSGLRWSVDVDPTDLI
ncbi:MAG: replication restart helicase PriA [Pseudohongiellaceae bacterium]